jgi:hypothetical protein
VPEINMEKLLTEMRSALADRHKERDERIRELEKKFGVSFDWDADLNAQVRAFVVGVHAGRKGM